MPQKILYVNIIMKRYSSYQVSVTAGTVMHKTRTSLVAWFWAIYLIAHDKRGSSSLLLKDCTWCKLPNGLGNFPQNS